mgnify:CR=1
MRTAVTTNQNFMPQSGKVTIYPTISLAELEKNSLSVDESEKRIGEVIRDFYHKKA